MIVTELFARLGVQLERASFRQAEGAITGLGKAMGSIGATLAGFFAANKFGQFIGDITHMGAALHDQSERLGITTEALQELGLAAQLAGADSSSLETGLKLLGRNAQQAATGSKEMAKAFRSNGISLKNANGEMKSSDQLLEDVADAMAKTDDPTKRTAIAMRLLGRSGAQLIPLLKGGAAGLREARAEAQALGGGLSGELIEAADEFDDNLTRLNFSLLSLKSIIGAPILNALDGMTRKLIGVIAQIRHWINTNRFFQYTLKIGIALLAAFAAQAMWAARATIAAWAKAAAPFIVIAGAVILLAAALDDLHALFTGGKSLLGQYLDKWNGVGAADNLVRNWAAGVRELTEAIRELFSFGDPTKFVARFKEVFSGLGGALGKSNDAAGLRGRREALVEAANSQDPVLSKIGKRDLAAFDREHFGQGDVVPRATGQGIGAGVEELTAGRASASSVAQASAAKNGLGSMLYDGWVSKPTVSAPAGPSTTPIQVNVAGTSVTVQASPGMDAREVAREAEKAARRVNEQQAKDIERALAPRATLRDFAQTLELE